VDVGQLGGGEGGDHLENKKNPDAMSSLYSYSTAEELFDIRGGGGGRSPLPARSKLYIPGVLLHNSGFCNGV
jgi:hypothetical protein